jgi:predicted nucleotidyltransferase component of viral defense system
VLPTPRKLLRLAEETGFGAASLEKILRLAELLEGIEGQEDLSRCLALKGGTALNLFFGPPGRLSVDSGAPDPARGVCEVARRALL